MVNKIIYIHPFTPINFTATIPVSIPALIHNLPYKVNGYFDHEINAEILINAEIAIIDIHWSISLAGAQKLILKLREFKKNMVIIAGGITASLYAKHLVEIFDIDYIIRGEAEIPLMLLIQAIFDGGDVSKIPNLVSKTGLETTWNYSLSEETFNNNKYYDIDFFPSFKREMIKAHKVNNNQPSITFYPFIVSFKGCNTLCSTCAGGAKQQQIHAKRKRIIRSPERVKEDLLMFSADKDFHLVNCTEDYTTLASPEYAENILSIKYDLFTFHEFASMPSMEILEMFLNSFKGGKLYFSIDDQHSTSMNFNQPEMMVKLIKKARSSGRYSVFLLYNSRFAKINKDYAQAVKYIMFKTACIIYDANWWWYSDIPQPDLYGNAPIEDFKRYYDKSAMSASEITENILGRAFMKIEKILPRNTSDQMRNMYYYIFSNAPFLFKQLF